jgi:hypothetical protein
VDLCHGENTQRHEDTKIKQDKVIEKTVVLKRLADGEIPRRNYEKFYMGFLCDFAS